MLTGLSLPPMPSLGLMSGIKMRFNPGLARDQALQNAPKQRSQQIVVPKVVEE